MSKQFLSKCYSSRANMSISCGSFCFRGRTTGMQERRISQPKHHLLQQHYPSAPNKGWGHTVRLIALEDLPHGKAYKGDVVTVKAGYARNHLIPQKFALYATPQNFERLGIIDPDFETEEERIARLQRESNMTATEDRYLKEADLLKKYLKNKVVSLCVCVICIRSHVSDL